MVHLSPTLNMLKRAIISHSGSVKNGEVGQSVREPQIQGRRRVRVCLLGHGPCYVITKATLNSHSVVFPCLREENQIYC